MRTCVAQELGKEETRKLTREAACVFSDLAVASANADSMESLGVSSDRNDSTVRLCDKKDPIGMLMLIRKGP